MESVRQTENIRVCAVNDLITVNFAMEELCRYIKLICEGKSPISIVQYKDNEQNKCSGENTICLGLYDELGLESAFESKSRSFSEFDDEIYIDIVSGRGIIAGINPRSVLLGVYRFLYEAGCRWLRPGPDGEYIPHKSMSDIRVKLTEKPSYRHRGVCIEGAVSHENVRDMIDWLPKIGMNSYFIQFREAYTFFDRWYSHIQNPLKTPEPFSLSKSREYVQMAVDEIEKRGLIYHAVGHGWTCEPFGIPGLGWDKVEMEIKPEIKQYLASVGGKRELWNNTPINTNLCYSNPEVRRIIVNDITEYLKQHTGIDIIHFWLADDINNHCECEECSKTIPSDFYVMMINELDERLCIENINTKVVFLVYLDLLWKPETQTIKNYDRFILMYAPTRSYSKSFAESLDLLSEAELPPYFRNKLKMPSSLNESLSFLNSWQKMFNRDSFDFDYHLLRDFVCDPGDIKVAGVLSTDIKNLAKIGLNGLMSCQAQRLFFPTGLSMYTMGHTLWDASKNFDDIAADYFLYSFGPEWQKCFEYLSSVSKLFDSEYMRGEKPRLNSDSAERFLKVRGVINDFLEKSVKPVCGDQLPGLIVEILGIPCGYLLSSHTDNGSKGAWQHQNDGYFIESFKAVCTGKRGRFTGCIGRIQLHRSHRNKIV